MNNRKIKTLFNKTRYAILAAILAGTMLLGDAAFASITYAQEMPDVEADGGNQSDDDDDGKKGNGDPKEKDDAGQKQNDPSGTGNVDFSDVPTSTSDFIMVGGDWVTPTATYGQTVNVVLPVVNMSVINLQNVIITPVIASNSSEWPFEIQTSGYTQTIPDLPGKLNGQDDMTRRRELTWTFKTRSDVLNGYYKLPFNVIYYNGSDYETATLTTWVKAVGAPGSGQLSDGGSALSTPRVIVTGFDTVPAKVYAGDTFSLTLHLKNTSKRTAVSNMQVDLTTPSDGTDAASTYEAFLPTSGSNTLYIERIGADSTTDITIEMTAKADLAQKPYAITVNMVYEDSDYATFNAKADVSIPINQDAKFDVGAMEIMPQDMAVGGQSNVMFSIYNTGKTSLYNVQVKFEADSVSGGDCFIGKIDPGGTGNVDAMVEGIAATMDDGTVNAVITYEDESGNVYTEKEPLFLYVYEEVYDESMEYGDPMMEEGGKKSHVLLIVVIVVILLIAGITTAVIFVIKSKKKKAQKELEDELDDDFSEDEFDESEEELTDKNDNEEGDESDEI